MRRVVITGLGVVSPLGNGIKITWDRIISGRSGIKPLTDPDMVDLPCRIAGQVPLGQGPGLFHATDWVSTEELHRIDKFILFAIAASDQALQDSGWIPQTEEQQYRTGVIIGSGIGGLNEIYNTSITLKEYGPRRVRPFFVPSCLINLASGQVAIRHKIKGPNHAVVTACASGAHAIGDAARFIQLGDADVMVCGGTEAAIGRLGIAGFSAAKALSRSFNHTPDKASRPWDKDRDGFVMGEGAGILILEELEHAKKRQAHIYAELVGYGLSGDAFHVTAPAPDGDGAYRAMKMAISKAQINAEDIGYINAHGTSTPLGDKLEIEAVHRLLGAATGKLAMSSTKSSIGHLLGAAGGVEAAISALVLQEGVLPPTLNLDECSEETDIDLIPFEAKEKKCHYTLSNSFGFGGMNVSLVFKSFKG